MPIHYVCLNFFSLFLWIFNFNDFLDFLLNMKTHNKEMQKTKSYGLIWMMYPLLVSSVEGGLNIQAHKYTNKPTQVGVSVFVYTRNDGQKVQLKACQD